MANSATVKLGVEGAAQLKRELSNITQQSKTLAAEMKATASAFATEADAEKKNAAIKETIDKQMDVQQKRIDLLKSAVEKYTAAEGESGNTTLKYREQLAKAETAMNDLEQQAKELEGGVEDVRDGMSDAADEASVFGDVLKANVVSDIILDGFRKLADAAKDFAKAMISTAAEVKAETSQFSQTFNDFSDEATDAINRVAESSGILPTRLNGAASSIYAFARSSGGSVEEAMSLMETALSAAADSAAYYDRSLEDTTDTLMSFLKGNFANDAALGVSATEATRNAKATELFGKKYADLTEIQKQETLLKMVTDAQKLSGAMGQAAREADGWENVQGNLNETWRQFQAQVGTPFLEALIPVVQRLTTDFTAWHESVDWEAFSQGVANVAEKVLSFGEWIVTNGSTILSVLVGIGTAFAAWKSALIIGEIIAFFQKFSSVSELLTAAQTALNATMLANPFVLVATLVAGLVAAFVTLYKTNDEFRATVDETWAKVKETVFTTIDKVIQAFKTLWSNIKTTVSNIKENVVTSFTNAFNTVRDVVTNIAGTIRGTIQNLISSALGWGRDLINGLVNGIRSCISSVTSAVSDVAARIRQFIHFSRPDVGPLRDYEDWMPDMISGMAKGIKNSSYMLDDALAQATKGMAVSVGGAASGGSTTNYGGVSINVYGSEGQSVSELADAVMDRIQNAVTRKGAAFA